MSNRIRRRTVPRLTASEREVVATIADDENVWTVFTDSARLTRRLLRTATRWGVTPEPVGAGWQFILPLKAIRFVGPRRVTPAQRGHLARLQDGRNGPQRPIQVGSTEGLSPRDDPNIDPQACEVHKGHFTGGSGR